jgi:hypothetical protein
MPQLAEIMTSAANPGLLQARYRVPTITAYNRLEPRPRSEDFDRSLRAEIRDALWMLTRQWQMGELEAEDCGSAIDARLLTKLIHVDRMAMEGNTGKAWSDQIPMEAFVEQEKVPFTHALRLQISQYFLKLHPLALRTKYKGKYLLSFGFDQNLDDSFKGQRDGLNLYTGTKSRSLDGEKIYTSILSGTLKTLIAYDGGDIPVVDGIAVQLVAWYQRQYLQPADGSASAWHPQQLEYQFSLAAPDTPQQVVLRAGQYYQGSLDWYNFDEDLRGAPLSTDDPNATGSIEDNIAISFLPAAATFKGMPNPRFWEMEERQIDFGKLNAKTTDLLLLVFAEFGLIYGNDWCVIPYKMAVNTLCTIKGLVITDVFGDRTLIRAADEGPDNDWQHWSMFNLSNKDHIGVYNRHFFLPATLTTSLESDPIEQVNFIRDEMANMVWGIEDIIPDATGVGIDGNEAADKSGVTPPVITGSTAAIRYVLGTTVPENWIPFLPIQMPGSVQDIHFQRATMPKLGSPPKDVVKAKGVLLTEEPSPYYINEEEIPYAGTIVRRSYQRSRWYNGKTYCWIGRYRETGRGEGSSNLGFDQIGQVNKL